MVAKFSLQCCLKCPCAVNSASKLNNFQFTPRSAVSDLQPATLGECSQRFDELSRWAVVLAGKIAARKEQCFPSFPARFFKKSANGPRSARTAVFPGEPVLLAGPRARPGDPDRFHFQTRCIYGFVDRGAGESIRPWARAMIRATGGNHSCAHQQNFQKKIAVSPHFPNQNLGAVIHGRPQFSPRMAGELGVGRGVAPIFFRFDPTFKKCTILF